MTGKESDTNPYKTLGGKLQKIRQRVQESLAEVSGAVEIEETTLRRIERGQERPTEDILLLLITHFGMQDDEAVQLWELAGYDHPLQSVKADDDLPAANRPMVMVMTLDSRIMYSDKTEIVANPNGVILNFMQAPNGPYTSQTIARIGMSREQAETMLKVLEQSLLQSARMLDQPKRLPTSESKEKPTTDSK